MCFILENSLTEKNNSLFISILDISTLAEEEREEGTFLRYQGHSALRCWGHLHDFEEEQNSSG